MIESARKIIEDMVGDRGLNLLINNFGALIWQGFPEVTEEDMLFHFSTNTVGPVMVFKEMLPLLQKSAARQTSGMSVSRAAVLNISSGGGSLGRLVEETPKSLLSIISYRTSKAALNMAMRVAAQIIAALTIKDQGILVVSMCPGWVKTDMGTDEGVLEVSESVGAMMNTLSQVNESHHGAFLNRNGETIPF
ncbi:uncharacterized protein CDAR_231941 [Caerostris darwini]|uniref:C-factor n=1 Tax=Caerostris darwini TaxID=1538125 RepID=A0AAV4QXG2_9ARAC|nr:uncharacterized protein CDAR_231941 [Caerostris darwini]